jgi:DhnA family fructose-bisphosphate aldolase class Ia
MFKKYRMNRLFSNDGKCFDVAIDHGMFNEISFLKGIEKIEDALKKIIDAHPDAIQLGPGQARIYQSIPDPNKPALVLRTDIANVYGSKLPEHVYSQLIDHPIEQALVLDAACVVVNLFLIPNQPKLFHQCLENICRIKPIADRYGMPLMIEPLVMKPNEKAGGYMVDGDIEKIVPLVRQAAELGADVIKADPCDNINDYHLVIEAASGVPVLTRGGGKTTEWEILERTYEIMKQGASGIVYGRNIIQYENPTLMTKALSAIVHDGKKPEEAYTLLTENQK